MAIAASPRLGADGQSQRTLVCKPTGAGKLWMNAVKHLTAPCVFVQARPIQLHGGRQRVDGAFYLPSGGQLRTRAARTCRDKGAHQPVKAADGRNNSPGHAALAPIIRSRSSRPRSPGVERVRGKMRGASAPGGREMSQMSFPRSSARRLRRHCCRRSERIKPLAPWSEKASGQFDHPRAAPKFEGSPRMVQEDWAGAPRQRVPEHPQVPPLPPRCDVACRARQGLGRTLLLMPKGCNSSASEQCRPIGSQTRPT